MTGPRAQGAGAGSSGPRPRARRSIDAVREKLDSIGDGAIVRSVRAARNQSGRSTISIGAPGRRPVSITLDGAAAESLRLMPGDAWTPDLADRVRAALEHDRAKRDAMNSLSRAPMSRRRLVRKLRDRGYDESVASTVADDLARIGLLNDRALAEAAARSMVQRRPAGARFVEMKLRQKGFDGALAREAAGEALSERDPLEDALTLARKKAAAMPAKLDRDARRRRLYGMLARRGYSPDVCRAAVDRLGEWESDRTT